MSVITGNQSWEFRLYGSVPPGIEKEQVMGIVYANVSILCAMTPFVHGQTVIVHEVSVEKLKAQIDAAAKKH